MRCLSLSFAIAIALVLTGGGRAVADVPHETQNYVTIAGSGIDGLPATSAQLFQPRGLAFDSSGNLYIVDATANRLRKVDAATGIITTVAGLGVAVTGFNGDLIPATHAQLNDPRGLVFVSGKLYIAEFGGRRVRKLDLGTGLITTVGGNGVTCSPSTSPCGDGGLATAAQLGGPGGVAVDSDGNIYIADGAGNRIRKVNVETGNITTVAGTGGLGSAGDGGQATAAQLNNPASITLGSAGSFYISEFGANRVRKVNGDGIITTFAGTGVLGFSGDGGQATAAQLNGPGGLGFDALGNLYISLGTDHRIRKVDGDGIITTFAGTGVAGSAGDGGQATAAQLNAPRALVLGSSGSVYVSETTGGRVRRVLTDGTIATVAGGGTIGVGDGGPATRAYFMAAHGAADSSGNVIITDQTGNRLRKIDIATGIITTIAGSGQPGFNGDTTPPDATGYPLAIEAQVLSPRAPLLDSSGNVYFGDSGNRRVRKVEMATGIITTIAGNGAACSPSTSPCGDGFQATASQLNAPGNLVFDPSGNLLIGDFGSNRIRKVDKISGIITTIAGSGAQCTSSALPCGDGGQATAAQFNSPATLAFDSAEDLYIGGGDDHRIRKVNMTSGLITSGIITTVAGTGIGGYNGENISAATAQLFGPRGLAFDLLFENYYIGEYLGHRVRKIDITSGKITTVAGTGVAGFSGDGGPATEARENFPNHVFFDPAENPYIVSFNNARVRRLNVAATVDVARAEGESITATIQLPAGRDASQVNLNSIRLQAINPADGALLHSDSNQVRQTPRQPGSVVSLVDTTDDGLSVPDRLIVRFDRATVAEWATGATGLVVRVEGQFPAPLGSLVGRFFSGDAVEEDTDVDGVGDFSDVCPLDAQDDIDADGLCGNVDNCPDVANSNQQDTDGDGQGDACELDDDDDGVVDPADNCALTENPGQADFDHDGLGDACDTDVDNDGVLDGDDRCLTPVSPTAVDDTGCAIADHCPCDSDWKNHGAYVSCVSHAAADFVAAHLITQAAGDAIGSQAAQSSCGK